jgi:hypothetical protein
MTLLKSLGSKLGKDKAGLVDLRRVVSELGVLLLLGPGSEGVLDVGLGVLGADHEANLARGVGGDGGVGVLGDGEDGTAVLLETSDERKVEPGALGLSSNDTALTKSIVEELEVALLEESLSGTIRVRGVGDDDVELVLVVVEELEAITNVGLGLGVVEATGHGREVLLGETDDSLVNVAKGGLLDTVVLDNLTENTTVATTNDKNLLGVGVGVEGKVGNHLLVGELIALGALDDVVEDENVAEVGGLEDEDVLVLALLMDEDLLNAEGHGMAGPHLRDLSEPAILDGGVGDLLSRHFAGCREKRTRSTGMIVN